MRWYIVENVSIEARRLHISHISLRQTQQKWFSRRQKNFLFPQPLKSRLPVCIRFSFSSNPLDCLRCILCFLDFVHLFIQIYIIDLSFWKLWKKLKSMSRLLKLNYHKTNQEKFYLKTLLNNVGQNIRGHPDYFLFICTCLVNYSIIYHDLVGRCITMT